MDTEYYWTESANIATMDIPEKERIGKLMNMIGELLTFIEEE